MRLRKALPTAISSNITSGLRRHNKTEASGRNIKLVIEYDGTNYAGWQRQKPKPKNQKAGKRAIQEVIEDVLARILQEKVRLIVSGRTDAGVHAQAQVANFKTKSKIILKKLQPALNGNLPGDIVILKAEKTAADFHSRFKAKSKLYRYTVLNRPYPSALLRDRVYFYALPLDIKLMQKEAGILLGRRDFRCFQARDKKEKGSVRTISKIRVSRDKGFIYIDVEADGFLYNMVRNIVGTLIEIGRGRFERGYLQKLLLSKDRKLAGPTVPARGLCLVKVKY